MPVKFRQYGKPPYRLVLVHGGPGAAGYLSGMAKKLSDETGVLETIHLSDSIEGQILELQETCQLVCRNPVILAGHSWGAWLSLLFAHKYPAQCQALILLSCPPFSPGYEPSIGKTRLERMNQADYERFEKLSFQLETSPALNRNHAFIELGSLFFRIDSFSKDIEIPEQLECDYTIYTRVWQEAACLRNTGKWEDILNQIQCPLSFIHGDFDPHPTEGLVQPLNKLGKTYNFELLKDCGHYPWLEPHVKDKFYQLIKTRIRELVSL
jgi:pimeloyl-ACP methyl ester carboxylesterase